MDLPIPRRGGLAAVSSSARMDLARSQFALGAKISTAKSQVDNREPQSMALLHVRHKARPKLQQQGECLRGLPVARGHLCRLGVDVTVMLVLDPWVLCARGAEVVLRVVCVFVQPL